MMTIKEQLSECDREIAGRLKAIKQWELKRLALLMERNDCAHQFTAPLKGYEHEGGTCIHCGINEIYAASQKIGKR